MFHPFFKQLFERAVSSTRRSNSAVILTNIVECETPTSFDLDATSRQPRGWLGQHEIPARSNQRRWRAILGLKGIAGRGGTR
jgi:hypothetical protein